MHIPIPSIVHVQSVKTQPVGWPSQIRRVGFDSMNCAAMCLHDCKRYRDGAVNSMTRGCISCWRGCVAMIVKACLMQRWQMTS